MVDTVGRICRPQESSTIGRVVSSQCGMFFFRLVDRFLLGFSDTIVTIFLSSNYLSKGLKPKIVEEKLLVFDSFISEG